MVFHAMTKVNSYSENFKFDPNFDLKIATKRPKTVIEKNIKSR